MANSKISALTSATTPLAGTEVLPIVQSSTTKQVSVANLTAGRSVSALDYVMSTGNLVPSTAAKGVNFTANTPAAGKTSQLLNWYEEGTWTPTVGAGLTVVGTFSSTGIYTRVGRQVTITGSLNGTTSVATAGGGVAICAGIPFAAGSTSIGIAAGVWTAPIGAVIISTTLYSATAIAATGTILFSVTYQV